jgi:hypothetical protein
MSDSINNSLLVRLPELAPAVWRLHPSQACVPWGAERVVPGGRWISTLPVLVFCFGPTLGLILLSFSVPISGLTLLAHVALGLSAFLSLWLLSDRPLLNPIQAFILLFQWWFGVGPAVCGLFYWLAGNNYTMESYLPDDPSGIWIVAAGLLIYAVLARFVTRLMSRSDWRADFLRPSGTFYRFRTIAAFATIAVVVQIVLSIFGHYDIYPFEMTHYLGRQVTTSIWLAMVACIAPVGNFALLALLPHLVVPRSAGPWQLKVLAAIGFAVSTWYGLSSGSKGLIVQPAMWAVAIYVSWRQRLPGLVLIGASLAFLLFVEPFVAVTRIAAQKASLTSDDQREFFKDSLESFSLGDISWREWNMESPFRGIYTHAVRVASRSDLFRGPWGGESLRQDLSTIIPRVLSPNKPDNNLGHYFAQQLGDPGAIYVNQNIAISVPFEFVGDYGCLAGIASFALIGLTWPAFICLVLTPTRLSTHPLMPYLLSVLLIFEQGAGQFINSAKLLIFPFAAVAAVWFVFDRKL